ncbi:MAG: hypothetical protein F7C07_01245 [Desulfurococcales archaeon]|nr:hypothetical protein [Desulfurococcales archaeon]
MPGLVIVSPPTLDLIRIGGRAFTKPGGPALYGGFGARLVGVRVFSVGPVGYLTLESTRAERLLGVVRGGYSTASPGFVFSHEYEAGYRRSSVLHRGPAMDPQAVLDLVDRARPDMALLSPIYGEEWGLLAEQLRQMVDCMALDLQGYVRAGLGDLFLGVVRGRFTLLHASDEDIGPGMLGSLESSGYIVYTAGTGPIRIVYNRGRLDLTIRGPKKIVEDPTGAGDIFTVLALYRFCSTWDVEEAVKYSVERTPHALEAVNLELAKILETRGRGSAEP